MVSTGRAVLPTVERGEGHHGVVVVHGARLPVPGVVAGQHAAGGVAQHRHALHRPAGWGVERSS